MEVWATGVGVPGLVERQAEGAEAAGFDGLVLVDSQNLAGDPTSPWPWPDGSPTGSGWAPVSPTPSPGTRR